MYYIGNIGIGILISFLIFINGALAKIVGNFSSLFIAHIIGFIVIAIIVYFKKAKKIKYPKTIYLYFGGIYNILNFFTQNITMKTIGISSTVIFIIVGQMISSIIIDHFGFFGREIHKLQPNKLISFSIILAGAVLINI